MSGMLSMAQYSDADLFRAYLATDMKTWDKYIHAHNFDKLSNKEKMRYINYEYGYVATAIDEKAPDAEKHLQDFEKHIAALKGILPKATVLDYESSCAAYKALMNKAKFISYGLESFNKIKEAYDKDPALSNLLLDPYFKSTIEKLVPAWRKVAAAAMQYGIPAPTMTSALSYFDGYTTERLPANLLQAQRDYFGAHTYERLDKPRGEFFHTNWTGHGGNTTAQTYIAG